MKTIQPFIIILAVFIFIQGCKSVATWQNYEESPENFAGMPVNHYFMSVAVSWAGDSFDTVNNKSIRVYLADDTLGSNGERSGKIYRDTWEIEAGAVITAYDWKGDVVTVRVLDKTNDKVLLAKRIKVCGKNATLLP